MPDADAPAPRPQHEAQHEPLPERPTPDDAGMITRAEEFYRHMKTRRTVRDFSPRRVPRAVIEAAIRTAGRAPSGANQQPWHFVAISDPALKHEIRLAAEEEERRFYAGAAGEAWLKELEPIGTTHEKPHLDIAPWLIVVFAQRWGLREDGSRFKHYYVPESVNIATGFLLAALHDAGLCSLTHTPAPMKFLTRLLQRPANEKPTMIIATGHPAPGATVPVAAGIKKPLDEIATFYEAAESG